MRLLGLATTLRPGNPQVCLVVYMLTGFKMVAALRNIRPQPTVGLHPDTAQKLGLEDGDWVYIETARGRITQQLSLDPSLDPRVVLASWGWWFPEEGAKTQYGWRKSNSNILTNLENLGVECGSPFVRGIPCRVYKSEEA